MIIHHTHTLAREMMDVVVVVVVVKHIKETFIDDTAAGVAADNDLKTGFYVDSEWNAVALVDDSSLLVAADPM